MRVLISCATCFSTFSLATSFFMCTRPLSGAHTHCSGCYPKPVLCGPRSWVFLSLVRRSSEDRRMHCQSFTCGALYELLFGDRSFEAEPGCLIERAPGG